MNKNQNIILILLSFVVAALIHACQQQPQITERQIASSRAETGNPSGDDLSSETGDESGDDTSDSESPKNFTLTWDSSADAAILSYKVFVVPPGILTRAPGTFNVPIQVKDVAIGDLETVDNKYNMNLSTDEINTALGAAIVDSKDFCFTIVAVNAIGNSAHSPKICP